MTVKEMKKAWGLHDVSYPYFFTKDFEPLVRRLDEISAMNGVWSTVD